MLQRQHPLRDVRVTLPAHSQNVQQFSTVAAKRTSVVSNERPTNMAVPPTARPAELCATGPEPLRLARCATAAAAGSNDQHLRIARKLARECWTGKAAWVTVTCAVAHENARTECKYSCATAVRGIQCARGQAETAPNLAWSPLHVAQACEDVRTVELQTSTPQTTLLLK